MKAFARHGDAILVKPGDIYVGCAPDVIRTRLGSCVAVTLWHPQKKVGGLCHFVMPEKEADVDHWMLNGRYADDAMLLLAEQFAKQHLPMHELVAKLFGGSANMPVSRKKTNHYSLAIGKRNIAKGQALLAHYDLPIAGAHLGNTGNRQIEFCVSTGKVRVMSSESRVPLLV